MTVIPNVIVLRYGITCAVVKYPADYEGAVAAVRHEPAIFDITAGTPLALFINRADYFADEPDKRVQLNQDVWAKLPAPVRTPYIDVRLQRDIDSLCKRGLDLWAEWDSSYEQSADIDFWARGDPFDVLVYDAFGDGLRFRVAPGVPADLLFRPVAAELNVTAEDVLMYHGDRLVLPGQTMQQLGAGADAKFTVRVRE